MTNSKKVIPSAKGIATGTIMKIPKEGTKVIRAQKMTAVAIKKLDTKRTAKILLVHFPNLF